ncbi:MAG: alanine racemase [Porticoccaceae bacterium]
MSRPTKMVINLAHLRHNLAVAKRYAGKSQVMAVIKANGYGHGAVRIAQALSHQGSTADAFAVASVDEALELRAAGITRRIVLLEGFFDPAELEIIAHERFDIVIHSEQQVEQLLVARFGGELSSRTINVWLKVDTGMQRLGIPAEQAAAVQQRLAASDNVGELRLMTHFACADTPEHSANQQQLDVFNQVRKQLPSKLLQSDIQTCIANSAALVALPNAMAAKAGDSKIIGDWVRPGIMLYGVNPLVNEHPIADDLLPVMTLSSRIISTRILKPGDSTGYGKDWIADRPMRAGIVAIGYGDGYPRHAPTGTPVLVEGKPSRLLGRVSMDMLAVDLTELPEYGDGDSVTLWGEGLPVWEVANHAGTIAYELLTGVAERVAVEVLT